LAVVVALTLVLRLMKSTMTVPLSCIKVKFCGVESWGLSWLSDLTP